MDVFNASSQIASKNQSVYKLDLNTFRLEIIKKDGDMNSALCHDDLIQALDQTQLIARFEQDGSFLHANSLFLDTMGYTEKELSDQHHRLFCYAGSEQEQRQLWEGT